MLFAFLTAIHMSVTDALAASTSTIWACGANACAYSVTTDALCAHRSSSGGFTPVAYTLVKHWLLGLHVGRPKWFENTFRSLSAGGLSNAFTMAIMPVPPVGNALVPSTGHPGTSGVVSW